MEPPFVLSRGARVPGLMVAFTSLRSSLIATIEGNGGSAGSAWSGDFHGEDGQVCHLEPYRSLRVHSEGC